MLPAESGDRPHKLVSRSCIRIDTWAMPPIRAIAFDSNVFGKNALPNVKTIRQWVNACAQHDADVLISEIVVHELAQHAVEVHDAFRNTYDAHRRAVGRWGIEPDPPLSPIGLGDVLSAIEDAGAVIVSLEGEDARQALLDQVLLRGAGQRKSGVKTGAADSAWIRSIVVHNDGHTEGLIVVTGDIHALEQTCASLGVDVPRHAKNLGELQHLLDESEAATAPWVSLFTSWVQEHFVNSSQGRTSGTPGEDLEALADLGHSNWWDLSGLPDDGQEMWEEQDLSISTVRSARVVNTIEHDHWTDSLSARLELEVEIEEQYARQDLSGHHVEYAARRYPARVRGTVRAFLEGASVDFDGLLEEIEFMTVESAEVDWQSI